MTAADTALVSTGRMEGLARRYHAGLGLACGVDPDADLAGLPHRR